MKNRLEAFPEGKYSPQNHHLRILYLDDKQPLEDILQNKRLQCFSKAQIIELSKEYKQMKVDNDNFVERIRFQLTSPEERKAEVHKNPYNPLNILKINSMIEKLSFQCEETRPIKVFSFENNQPDLRNEFLMGIHKFKSRLVKVIEKVKFQGKEITTIQNAHIVQGDENDFRTLSIEYYSHDQVDGSSYQEDLSLEDAKDRQFMLSQDPAVVEIDQAAFNTIFRNVDPELLTFDMLTHDPIKKKSGIWPVVILNNCSPDMLTKEFLCQNLEDDLDLIRADNLKLLLYKYEQGQMNVQQSGKKMENPFEKNEVQKIFDENEEEDDCSDSFLNQLSEDGDERVPQNKKRGLNNENLSNGSFDDLLQANEKSQNQPIISEENENNSDDKIVGEDGMLSQGKGTIIKNPGSLTRDEQDEQDMAYYKKSFDKMQNDGCVLIWFVGTSHYEVRKLNELKRVSYSMKNQLNKISRESATLKKVVNLFALVIKNYNRSNYYLDYSTTITTRVARENIQKIAHIQHENKAYYPALLIKIIERRRDKLAIFRSLDDFSMYGFKVGTPKVGVKSIPFLPSIELTTIEKLNNLQIAKNYRKENFIKKNLLSHIYLKTLIDANYQQIKMPIFKVQSAQTQNLASDAISEESSQIHQVDKNNTRCKVCNYILGNVPYKKCTGCQKYYHNHCLQEQNKRPGIIIEQKESSDTDLDWKCADCRSCTYCLSNENKEQMLACISCDKLHHSFCMTSLHKNYKQLKASKFICPDCATCSMCRGEISNMSDKNIMEDGTTLCNECIDLRSKKEYCPLCNKRWEFQDHPGDKQGNEMIECQCKMWVHRKCDKDLTEELYREFSLTGRVYYCPKCRNLDEQKTFALPVDHETLPHYRQVINTPMDFQTMYEKAQDSEYLEDTFNRLKNDFDLICSNALTYNMPKSTVYNQAKRLKKFGDRAFKFFKELLQSSQKEFLKYSKKLFPNYYSNQFKKEIDEYQLDIVYEHAQANPQTRIKLVESTKTQPKKRGQNKEIILEISGLNHLLPNKTELEQKRNQFESMNENNIELEYDESASSEVKSEVNLEPKQKKAARPQVKLPPKESVQLVDDLLGQDQSNKPQYYFNPVGIQFSNPQLINQDLCYLCGSFGDPADQIRCKTCQECYHYYCISRSYHDKTMEEVIKNPDDWQCPRCKLCQKCGKKSESNDCLICEECDNLFHLDCIYPDVNIPFTNQWRCEDCFKCQRCGTNKLFSEHLTLDSQSIQSQFCENYQYCYECGLKLAYYKFCRICKRYCQKSVSGERAEKGSKSITYMDKADDSIECTICKFKYHFTCYEEEYFPVTNHKDFVCYNCKVNEEEIEKMEQNLDDRADKIIEKRRNLKLLFRYCEIIFLQLISNQVKTEANKENIKKNVYDYIIEDQHFLLNEPHIKSVLENFKLMNAATKLINTKNPNYSSQKKQELKKKEQIVDEGSNNASNTASSSHRQKMTGEQQQVQDAQLSSTQNEGTMIAESTQSNQCEQILKYDSIEEILLRFLSLYTECPLSDQIFVPEYNELLLKYKDFDYIHLIDSIQLYTYHTYIQIPNLVVTEGEETESFNYRIRCDNVDNLELWEEKFNQELPLEAQFLAQKYDCLKHNYFRRQKMSLGSLEQLVEDNRYQFQVIDVTPEYILVNEEFDQINGTQFMNVPYYKSLSEMALSIAFKLDEIRDKRGLLVRNNREESNENDLVWNIISNSHYDVYPLKYFEFSCQEGGNKEVVQEEETKSAVNEEQNQDSGKIVEENATEEQEIQVAKNPQDEDGQIIDESQELAQEPIIEDMTDSYADFRKLIVSEMIAIETMKRRLRAFITYKKDLRHSAVRKTITLTKGSNKTPEKSQQNGPKAPENASSSATKAPSTTATTTSQKMVSESQEVIKVTKRTDRNNSIEADDVLIPNILSDMPCVCCKKTGDRKISGRLLFIDNDQWVHANCAIWSYDVAETEEGGLANFFNTYKRSLAQVRKRKVCTHCQKSGPTLNCFSKKCQNRYHFNCAFQTNCSFLTIKKFYCKSCSGTKNLQNKINTDFSTRRRLYIVRNTTFFYTDNSSQSLKEKPLEMQIGSYNRVGTLTLLSAKKYDSDVQLILNQYTIAKIISNRDQNKRDTLIIKLQFAMTSYQFSADFIDPEILQNKKNLTSSKIRMLTENNFQKLDSAQFFFEYLKGLLGNQSQEIISKQILAKEPLWQKEFLGEFLGLHSHDVKKWLKSSTVIEDNEVYDKVEQPSFKEHFYNENLDELNAFQQVDKFEDIHLKLKSKLDNLYSDFSKKEDFEKRKNPKDASFHPNSRIQNLNRAPMDYGELDLGNEEDIVTEVQTTEPIIDSNRFARIQQEELLSRLKDQYQKHKQNNIKAKVAPSPIHKYGLFALEKINKDDLVIEYCGEVIRNKIADLRETTYKKQGFGDCFMFRADSESVIDASFIGNEARYLNHCCNPNCSSTILVINDEPHIVMYANRPIYAGEELTYDYQFDVEQEKIKCTCGAPNCLGRLN